jgi:hypothetical protein
MAEEIRNVHKVLADKGFSPQNIMATYNMPKEFADGIQDISYGEGKLKVKIPAYMLTDDVSITLDQVDSVLIYVGKGAIGIAPGSKSYFTLDLSQEERDRIGSVLSEIGYETEDTHIEKVRKKYLASTNKK